MSPEVISIIVLGLMFLIGTVRNVNLGVLGLVAAFAVGLLVVHMSTDDILAGFPVDLLMALMGLTFLFGFAQQNGSIDLLVGWGLKAVRGRVALAPWIFFALTGVLMSLGAIFAIACIAPLAIPFARKYNINQLMMGMMVVHGGMTGAFSPISVYGAFVNGFLVKEGLPSNQLVLFLIPLVFNLLIGIVIYTFLGGRQLMGLRLRADGVVTRDGEDLEGSTPAAGGPVDSGGGAGAGSSRGAVAAKTRPAATPPVAATSASTRPTGYQSLTLIGLAVLAIGTAGLQLDISILSLTIAAVLAIVNPAEAKKSLANVSWPIVVLVGGVVTYINVMQTAGAIDYVSTAAASIGIPLLVALLLCYMAGIVSALASSLATIGVAIAIAAPMLADGALNPIGFVAALAISATVVDVSPFSTNGAMVLANVDEANRDKYFRQMLVYSGVIVAAAPALAWLAVFLPIPF
ncbi:SLC13 family permease [soil metagenome]